MGENNDCKSFYNKNILIIMIYISMKNNSIKHILIIHGNIKNNFNKF